MTKEKHAGIELLRIIFMMMVVGLHYLYYGILFPQNAQSMAQNAQNNNFWLAMLLESIIIYAVNGYILISGFFGLTFKAQKLLRLVIMMWFYSVFIYLVFVAFGLVPFSILGFISSNVPRFWWFVFYYIILYVASPALNIILKNINQGQHLLLLVVMGLFFCLVPSLSGMSFTNDRGFGLINFVFMYFIGRYIGIYQKNRPLTPKQKALALLGFAFCTAMIYFGNLLYSKVFKVNLGWQSHFFGYDTLFVICGAVLLLQVFRSINIGGKLLRSAIFFVAPATLGVYLIHEHVLVRANIYNNLLKVSRVYTAPAQNFVLHFFACMFAVFFFCAGVEKLRIKLLTPAESWLVSQLVKMLDVLKNNWAKVGQRGK